MPPRSNRINVENIKNIENVNVTINELKRTSSEESISSCSTVSDSGVKRRRKLNYFSGTGTADWKPQSRLLLQDIDITSHLKNYRRRNIKSAKEHNDLSDMKILSLSHIFPINNVDENKCVTKLFGNEAHKQVVHDNMYEGVNLKRASTEALVFCKDMSDRRDGTFEPANEVDEKIKACCLHFKNNNYSIQVNSETSFIQKYLLPFFNEFFLTNTKENIICAMVDGTEENGTIPDWKLGYRFKSKNTFVFFVEVKRPGQPSKYQAESDYVKLMKEMKESVDGQIDLGFVNPISFGLLVEGFRCVLYMMTIKEDGIYMPIMIKKFWLMEELENAVNIPATIESLLFVKEGISNVNQKFKSRSREKPLKKFKKPSFYTKFE